MKLSTNTFNHAARAAVCAVGASALMLAGAGAASAQSQTGWVGPTPPKGGVVYLHSSTITDTPALAASTALYPSFGQSVPSFRMGVQSRLFKSGVLCQITPWQYNPNSTARLENKTSGNCGTGSYNSHGFVQVSDGETWSNYVTFPTNPIDFTAPPAVGSRSAKGDSPTTDLSIATNDSGKTFGSAANANSPESVPDLIASYGADGTFGYVKADDVSAVEKTAASVPLYTSDGVTVVGSLDVK
ncbi:hypothetical protein [Rhodococcus sp. H29-C3]|uniref:hypothetical protein n=1 Tax=Rhodococcus sp. H29-C3 TaxID=3046307 RepID=UPI0024BA598F|nr:hypothetical protein [Rhodococcus sp. H29-C3]MDJ0363365.1 hypothetical protein [Rhodococcus sp. H29-C3]